jgi:PAS domain S-box-containing protein
MGETQAIEDINRTRGYQLPQTLNYPSMICIPIKQNNRVQQVLCVVFDEPQKFESRDLNTLSLLASQAAGHLENASLHKQIGASNNRMRAILDSTRDGVILLDQDARIAEVNASAQRLLGINLSEHIGERFVDVLLYHTEFDGQRYAGYTRDELNDLAKSPWLYPEKYTRRQFEHRTAQGEVIHIEEIGSMVYDEQNHVTGRLLVLRDITEQKLLDAYREEITKMMIHDLRAPLASIIGSIDAARQSVTPDDNSRLPRTLGMARDSADKMMDLVNSILDIARLENRQSAVQLVPTPVRHPIESAYRALSSSIQKAGLNIEFLIPENLPEVMIDQDKIRRVFINLLDNAVRYTPFGGSIQISVTPELEEGRLLVRVADSGSGIPEKARERIFGKYEQVKENQPLRGSKGTGLGLAFCKLVIEAHGQRIWVEANGPLPGACFAFTLPVYNPDA